MEESAQQAEQPTSTRSLAAQALLSLGQLRDGFLVAGAAVYALGFVTWAIHSWRVAIGFIDVFKAQYIVAGLVPTILILFTLSYIARAHRYLQLSGVCWRGIAVVFCFILAILHVFKALTQVLFYSGIEDHFLVNPLGPMILESSGMVLVLWRMFLNTSYLFFSSNMFFYPLNILNWLRVYAVSRYFPVAVAVGVVIVFLLLSTMVYVLKVFPRLPQEMGGGQERCARLDVQLDKLSEESAEILIGQGKAPEARESPLLVRDQIEEDGRATEKKIKKLGKKDDKPEETVTTLKIYVVYMSDKSLFFSLSRPIERAQKYEVSREAISLISWCVRSDPA